MQRDRHERDERRHSAMSDGEAKTTAMKEMQMAEEMMAKKDMKGCCGPHGQRNGGHREIDALADSFSGRKACPIWRLPERRRAG